MKTIIAMVTGVFFVTAVIGSAGVHTAIDLQLEAKSTHYIAADLISMSVKQLADEQI